MIPRYILSIKLGDLPIQIKRHSKICVDIFTFHISTQIFLRFLLDFSPPSAIRASLAPSVSWQLKRLELLEAPPMYSNVNASREPNLVTQELIFGLTKIIQKLMSNLQKQIFDCPIYTTLKSIETCSPSIITQVSSPPEPNRTSGVLQPTSDAQSRLCDFHQQATEEDNQWKHWRHQGGDKAHSGTILRKKRYERDVAMAPKKS